MERSSLKEEEVVSYGQQPPQPPIEFSADDNPHIGLFTMIHITITRLRTLESGTDYWGRFWDELNFLLALVLAQLSQFFVFAFLLIVCSEMSSAEICGSHYVIHMAWLCGWLVTWCNQVFRMKDLSWLSNEDCYVSTNVVIAWIDMILEYGFDVVFTILSLFISFWFSVGPLSFILNRLVVQWLANLDNELSSVFFSVRKGEYLVKMNCLQRKPMFPNFPIYRLNHIYCIMFLAACLTSHFYLSNRIVHHPHCPVF
eukprot:TRINITY_DN13520_c0_g2_i2.p1 TRINITY_DN13520_c0_g2~~TRINITY_DN13520_c0_g2_i2.p1  ORF type:complete len:271 (+),score=37.66 TRINITY_DN13520_c0_g2_i2:47-814(+)